MRYPLSPVVGIIQKSPVRSVKGVVQRTDVAPMWSTTEFGAWVHTNGERRWISGSSPHFVRYVGNIRIAFDRVVPEQRWDSNMHVTKLKHGGVLHSDRQNASGLDVLWVPGKNSPFLSEALRLKIQALAQPAPFPRSSEA